MQILCLKGILCNLFPENLQFLAVVRFLQEIRFRSYIFRPRAYGSYLKNICMWSKNGNFDSFVLKFEDFHPISFAE